MLSAAMTLARLWIFALVCTVLSACQPGTVSPELYPGLKGGMALPQVLAQLGLKREQLKVVGDSATAANDPRPPYHLEELEVSHTNCLGVPCGLRLVLFNKELAEVVVFPTDAPKFGNAIRWLNTDVASSLEQSFARRGVRFRSGHSDFVGNYYSFGDSIRMRRADKWVYKYD